MCANSFNSKAGETAVVLREWAGYAGNTDSTFVVPILSDGDFTYSATYLSGTPTGTDIVLTKYTKSGSAAWKIIWTGSGVGRDQPSDMVMDSDYIYLCGITYASATNYDFLTMQIRKSDGVILWVKTYNSPFSNYDVATSIGISNHALYLTGVTYLQATLGDYHTIKYDLSGNVIWQRDFDYNNLMDIPFDLSVNKSDTTIVITGGSQSSVADWDYQTLIYDTSGTLLSQPRTSGSTAGFDRAAAVQTDDSSYIYITGATRGSTSDYDIKTIKLRANGNLVWSVTYDGGGDDIANDLIVDRQGNVYICGESQGNGKDFIVQKVNAGRTIWTAIIDGSGNDDIAYKMCFDSNGNIIVTGKGYNQQTYSFDFLTVAFNPDGRELWRDYFDGPEHGADEARNITADTSGNIFVTGQVTTSLDNPTVTIKYRTDFFNSTPTTDSPSSAYMFYPNEGQILDTQDSSITDSTHYYMLHHNPQLFFGYGVMNMVFSHVDQDTSTVDTLQRVDVSFLNSTNPTKAFPVNVNDSMGYLNYYLGHCPNGITHVNGSQKIVYTDVYAGVDAEYSSNDAGLKLKFIVNPGSTKFNEIGLKFDGQTSLTVLNNWQLRVTTPLGTYDFEKPKIYQLDSNNARINLPWYLSWQIQNGNEAIFTGNGTYDGTKTLIVEISKTVNVTPVTTANMEYSTYYGSTGWDEILASDNYSLQVLFGGFSSSIRLPLLPGSNSSTVSFLPNDGFVFRMEEQTGRIMWGTFYGGSGDDRITDLKVGNAVVYVCGFTHSDNLPQNSDPSKVTIINGGSINQNNNTSSLDNFIAKFDYSSGTLIWANYIGSTGNEGSNCAVAYDPGHDKVFLAGTTTGTNFPTQPFTGSANPYFQSSSNDGGSASDGYLMRFAANGVLEWSTYFGSGAQDEIRDVEFIPGFVSSGHVYISGTTRSTSYDQANVCNAPPVSGGFPNCNLHNGTHLAPGGNTFLDAFITEFSENLEMQWSTMFGGLGDELVNTHSLAGYDNIIFLGISNVSNNANFPSLVTCTNCFNQSYSAGDPFIAKFDNRTLSWSTFYGTGGSDFLGSLKTYDRELFICGGTDRHATSAQATYCSTPNAGELPLCQGPSGYYFDPNYYYVPGTPSGSGDAFLASFNRSNQLSWATLAKGNYLDRAWDLTVDHDFLFLSGRTNSAYITTTAQDYPQEFLSGAYNQHTSAGNVEGFVSRFTLGLTIGITDLTNSELIASAFPNPTTAKLILKAKSNINKFDYSIFNLLGEAVRNKTHVNSNSTEIDCSMLSSGAYFLIVQSDNEISTLKLIKN